MIKRTLIIGISLLFLLQIYWNWDWAKPWDRNYLGQEINPYAFRSETIPSNYLAFIYSPQEGTLSAGIYRSQKLCQEKIQQFWQIAAAIKQIADFADWHIYCQKQNQHQTLNEHHQVLDDYIKQAQDLLAQHHLQQTKNVPASTAAAIPASNSGKIKWVVVATDKNTKDKYFLENLPPFNSQAECSNRVQLLQDKELAETGNQELKDKYNLSCLQRLWRDN